MNGTEENAEHLTVLIVETILIGTVSVFGFLCNFLSFLILIRHRAFKNAFGYLAAYEALSNSCILLIFSLWATPWTLLKIPIKLHGVNLFIGQTSLLFVESAYHCCLLIAINRFVAVMFPAFYRSKLNERVTQLLLLIISLISLLYFGIYFIDGCSFYYDHQYEMWTFGVETCSQNMAFYVDMCYNVAIFVTIYCIDVVVFVHLRLATKSFLSSFIYAFMLLCFHLLTRLISSGFGLFMCTTFVWGFAHAAGGLIFIYFNAEIRRHLVGIRHFLKFLRNPVSMTIVKPHHTAFTTSQK